MSQTSICTRLQEADNAYHASVTGQGVTTYKDQNGETIVCTPTNRGDLLDYIRLLAPLCPSYVVIAPIGGSNNRPFDLVF